MTVAIWKEKQRNKKDQKKHNKSNHRLQRFCQVDTIKFDFAPVVYLNCSIVLRSLPICAEKVLDKNPPSICSKNSQQSENRWNIAHIIKVMTNPQLTL